jgi:hypothetical protein
MKMVLRNIARIFRTSVWGNTSLYHALRFERKRNRCDKIIRTFLGDGVSQEKKTEIVRNMRRAMVKYHWDPDEYFLFGYENLTDNERKEYLTEYDKNSYCDKVNNPEKSEIFHMKWRTYEVFKVYFKREAVLVHGSRDIDNPTIIDFLRRHNSVILKPLYNAGGHGIVMFHASNKEDALNECRNIIRNNDNTYIMEELIIQSKEMAEFHANSVNTVRMFTFRLNDDVRIFCSGIRFGRDGKNVDNGGSGGIFASVDVSTGIVATTAMDNCGREYSAHPNSGKQIKGYVVPKWEELLSLSKELALVVPDVRIVGWDFALTDNGWVLVEGNDRAQFHHYQIPMRKGFMKEFRQIQNLM